MNCFASVLPLVLCILTLAWNLVSQSDELWKTREENHQLKRRLAHWRKRHPEDFEPNE